MSDKEVTFNITEGIHFRGVTFKYPTAKATLKNTFDKIDFTVKAGEITAIVGPSGSGKSTIVQLIERFYDPSEGDIFFDSINIKDISLKTLRESIGYVS